MLWKILLGFLALVVLFVLVALASGVRRALRFRRTLAALKPGADANAVMREIAEHAVDWARGHNVALDYSPGSVERLEELLGKMGQVDERRAEYEAIRCGAYIGEVIRRAVGGEWALDHEVAGPMSFPFTWGGDNTSFPVGWCWKRMVNGEEDNVWHKYQVFLTGRAALPDEFGGEKS